MRLKAMQGHKRRPHGSMVPILPGPSKTSRRAVRHVHRLRRIFPGWWVLTGGFIATALFSASTSYGTALFLIPLTLEFGWTRTAVSTALALARLESGIGGPVEGVMVDRWGPRRVMLLGIPLAGLGYYLWAHLGEVASATEIDVLVVFYVVYVGFVALGGAFASNTAVNAAVAHWFRRRRGLALGIVSSGHGLGAAVWVPILGLLIQEGGWRSAVIFQGAVIFVLGIPAALLVRHKPEQYGFYPDGDRPSNPSAPELRPREREVRAHASSLVPHTSQAEPEYTIGQALRTSAFWCLAFAFAFRVMVTNAVQVHIAALLQDIGMSPLASAGVLSALSALSIIGRFGMGWIGDLFERRRVYLIALVMMIAGLLVLSVADRPWIVIPFLALYAPAYGGLAALASALRGDYFGVRAFGTISGAMGPITTLGTIIGPLFAGYVFDTTGSYQIAMVTFAFCGLISLALMFLAKRPLDTR